MITLIHMARRESVFICQQVPECHYVPSDAVSRENGMISGRSVRYLRIQ
jgi:hypothetical protein